MAKIEVRFNDVVLREVPLDKPFITVGRSAKNDIAIDNMAVSRKHARIYQEGPRFIVEDLKSLNGTFVNNKKTSQWILSDNDQILIGKQLVDLLGQRTGSDGDVQRQHQRAQEARPPVSCRSNAGMGRAVGVPAHQLLR